MFKKVPVDDDIQTVTKFLFFPKTIGNELRWLERATWKRKYTLAEGMGFWNDEEWVNSSTSSEKTEIKISIYKC